MLKKGIISICLALLWPSMGVSCTSVYWSSFFKALWFFGITQEDLKKINLLHIIGFRRITETVIVFSLLEMFIKILQGLFQSMHHGTASSKKIMQWDKILDRKVYIETFSGNQWKFSWHFENVRGNLLCLSFVASYNVWLYCRKSDESWKIFVYFPKFISPIRPNICLFQQSCIYLELMLKQTQLTEPIKY